MKKFVFASVMALASLSLVPAHTLRAQDSGAISIKDPAEYNAYQMANSQTDPKAKAAAMEDFLTKYPQTVLKKAVLGDLLRTYQGLGQPDQALGAATRILQVEPDNLEAIYTSVFIKKGQCAKTSDQQTCDDMAALAQKGLNAQKPAGLPDDQWKAQTDAVYPPFHSALALADLVSKKDPAGAVEEYRKELGMYADTTKGAGLVDTLQLATAEEKLQLADAQAARDADAKVKATPGDATLTAAAKAAADKAAQDNIQAIWLFARAWNFAPPSFKPQIEQQLEYYYKKYHGDVTGLDAVKSQAAGTLFPPASFTVTPAKTQEELIHDLLASTTDWNTLALSDKETVLSGGSKEDADKLWTLLQGKDTPVPGTVIESNANQIKVAVTQDAKDAKTPDFIVNLKEPLAEKEIPAVGSELKLLKDGGPELDGTYDTYSKIPASAEAAASAQIVLKDGMLQTKKAPAHKPAPGHRPAASAHKAPAQ
ncbi:MAG TPA: hypothetical protein VKB47_06205 [Terracidiphilus sp.]|nr:hypothetical protein [Terracidiphilus sp.]